MKRLVHIVLAVFGLTASSPAQSEFKKVGSAGYVFLTIPVGARTAALGEATVALRDLGPEALFNNPAALGFQPADRMVAFSYAPWIAETEHEAASLVYRAGDVGVFGLGVVRLDFGDIPRYEPLDAANPGSVGVRVGTYSADAMALGLTFGRRVTERFAFAITGKLVQERIAEYRSSNVVFDGGIVYVTGLGSLRIGGAVRNFGVESKYVSGLFKMPTDFRFGVAAEVIGSESEVHRVTVMSEFLHPTDNTERVNVGLEYGFAGQIFLRGGYKFLTDEESWTAGVGVVWQVVNLDAAFVDMGRLGGVARVTVGIVL